MKKMSIANVTNFASLKFSGNFRARNASTNAVRARKQRYPYTQATMGILPIEHASIIDSGVAYGKKYVLLGANLPGVTVLSRQELKEPPVTKVNIDF